MDIRQVPRFPKREIPLHHGYSGLISRRPRLWSYKEDSEINTMQSFVCKEGFGCGEFRCRHALLLEHRLRLIERLRLEGRAG